MRVVFMGTPHFAVPVLERLAAGSHTVAGVVTAPDKPAGRGQKLRQSAVKEASIKLNLPTTQPHNLKDPQFINTLKQWSPDIIVVVAFRMLPREVYALPPKGSINLHASLLPQYRGAAPIQRAIINGEKVTGLTTFLLDEKTDTGDIILQIPMDIGDNETAGELHDRMMAIGAELVENTLNLIEKGEDRPKSQQSFIVEYLKKAPKISKSDCLINFMDSAQNVFNHIRGLSPYPGAFMIIKHPMQGELILKVYKSKILSNCTTGITPGKICSDGKTHIKINCGIGSIKLCEVQLQGRKQLNVIDFLRGFDINSGWTAVIEAKGSK